MHKEKQIASERSIKKLEKREYGALTDETFSNFEMIARNAFGSDTPRKDRIQKRMLESDFTYLFYINKELIGFAFFKNQNIGGSNVLYLDTIVVEQKNQGKGFFYDCLQDAVDRFKPQYIAMRTQSRVLYHAMTKLAERNNAKLYPSGNAPNKEVTRIAASIAEEVKADSFDDKLFVERGVYMKLLGQQLYTKEPQVADRYTNRLFDEVFHIDMKRGDALLLIAKFW